MLDYVVHYNALFDQLDLSSPVDLVGHSLGGWMAGLFTVLNGRRVRRLALACPAGLRVAEHPTVDMFAIRAEQDICHDRTFAHHLIGDAEISATCISRLRDR
jgi:pimeloyl-ACP methyl ester carboxylesterase